MRRVASLLHRILEKNIRRECVKIDLWLHVRDGENKSSLLVFSKERAMIRIDCEILMRRGGGNLVFEFKKKQIKNKLRVRVECE